MSHPCPIKGCTTPAKDEQMMCWPHWRRVPKALNRAIFETYRSRSWEEYGANRDEAIRIVNEKEAT
jgi:hypothetical protein